MSPTLDIVIPTYNRPDLLDLTLSSINRATKPSDLILKIIIADNNSNPINRKLNSDLVKKYPDLVVVYLVETNQGRSWAINAGIKQSQADYVAFIDDDEEIQNYWIEVAYKNILSSRLDYIVGPCMPNWEKQPPSWLPIHTGQYKGVLGWIEQSAVRRNFDDFDGTLVGGNSIVRRTVLNTLNGYSTQLGRGNNNLMGGEDEELHRRLKGLKATGFYDPELIIFHFIPAKRMTVKYHLRWAFWSGCSNGSRLKWEGNEKVPYLLGLPRYRLRKALEGLIICVVSFTLTNKRSTGFTGVMDFSYYLGMIYGRFFFKN